MCGGYASKAAVSECLYVGGYQWYLGVIVVRDKLWCGISFIRGVYSIGDGYGLLCSLLVPSSRPRGISFNPLGVSAHDLLNMNKNKNLVSLTTRIRMEMNHMYMYKT